MKVIRPCGVVIIKRFSKHIKLRTINNCNALKIIQIIKHPLVKRTFKADRNLDKKYFDNTSNSLPFENNKIIQH